MSNNMKPLDALAERINAGHLAYLSTARKALEHALDVGAALQEAKSGLPHGEWLPWLQANCPGISERTAQRYMRLTQNRGRFTEKSDTVADLTVRAAEKSIAEPNLTPPDGHAFVSTWQDGEAYIWPSGEHPGYFFFAVIYRADGSDGPRFVVEGFSRPVRGDGLTVFFGPSLSHFMPTSAKWETVPADPWPYNIFLGRPEFLGGPGGETFNLSP